MKMSTRFACSCFLFLPAFAKTPLTPEGIWKKIADSDNIVTFVREYSSKPTVAFRGEGLFDIPVLNVVETIVDTEKFKDWMTETVEMKVIRQTSEFDWLIYDRVPVPFPFKDRDFVITFNININSEQKSVKIIEKSVEDESTPPLDCCVRGYVENSTYEIEPREDGKKSLVKMVVEFDPAGNLPNWLVKPFLKDTARKTLVALRDQSLKGVSAPHPKIRKLLE